MVIEVRGKVFPRMSVNAIVILMSKLRPCSVVDEFKLRSVQPRRPLNLKTSTHFIAILGKCLLEVAGTLLVSSHYSLQNDCRVNTF